MIALYACAISELGRSCVGHQCQRQYLALGPLCDYVVILADLGESVEPATVVVYGVNVERRMGEDSMTVAYGGNLRHTESVDLGFGRHLLDFDLE